MFMKPQRGNTGLITLPDKLLPQLLFFFAFSVVAPRLFSF